MPNIAEPEQFQELCELVGIAVLMSQKVQFALAHFYAAHHIVHSKWTKGQANESIARHLSGPMGIVVTAINEENLLSNDLHERIGKFKQDRNWLVHDFDQEATPFLVQGEKFPDYVDRMSQIYHDALALMTELDAIGEELIPIRG